MGLIRPAALLLALVMASPALYRAFVTENDVRADALARFLLAVPVAALMLAALRFVVTGYGTPEPARIPLRRRSDPARDDMDATSPGDA